MMILTSLLVSLLHSTPLTADQTIVVGIAANFSEMTDSTSNPYAHYLTDGLNLAIEDNSELLKQKGLKIKIKEFDYKDDKLKVIETANAAIKSDVIAVIGYIYSSHALLAGPIFNDNKLLLLSPSATADRLEEIGKYVRRTCFSDSYQGEILANFAWQNKKIKSVSIVSVADCAYCQSLRNSFKTQFQKLGGKILSDSEILTADSDFKGTIQDIKNKNPDAVFLPTYERVAGNLVTALYDAGIRPPVWLGGDGWGNSVELFYNIVGNRNITAYVVTPWHRDLQNPQSLKFAKTYLAKYGKQPIDTSAVAYEAMDILIKGIVNAKSISREGIVASLENLKDISSISGNILYKNGTRTPVKQALILKNKNKIQTIEKQLEIK
jgi:branched-chain amino acid transport system substrate-binding protein